MNRARSIIASVTVALVLVLASSGEVARGSSAQKAPPTPSVSFRRDVAPVLAQSCSTRSCHGGDSRPPVLNAKLDPSKLRAALVGVQSEERATHAYVRPGDPDASYLVQKIEGHLVNAECTDHDCGDRMPLDNPALSENSRKAIRAWIASGAPDN